MHQSELRQLWWNMYFLVLGKKNIGGLHARKFQDLQGPWTIHFLGFYSAGSKGVDKSFL